MANFSAAFGYNVYIMPLASADVDTAFTGISTGTGTSSTAFMNLGAANANVLSPTSSVTYTGGIFTVAGTAFDMDGLDKVARLYGLTNASLETDTNSEEILTYDDETKGFNLSVPTSKSWSVSLAGVADFKDAGYQIVRLAEQNTVADSLRVKFARVGPTGTDETIYGYGTLTGYTESIEAGAIVSWEATLQGYGAYRIDLDANPAPSPTP
jgi:hypothetical protein